jgi:hypothetical protein
VHKIEQRAGKEQEMEDGEHRRGSIEQSVENTEQIEVGREHRVESGEQRVKSRSESILEQSREQ